MGIFDFIATILILFVIFLLVYLFFHTMVIYPYVNHKLNNPNNKIQLQCKETDSSYIDRINNHTNTYKCQLFYRVNPESLNWITKIYGNNYWEPLLNEEIITTDNPEQLKKELTNKFKTLQDIINNKEHILWIE